jgi:hypothetical protein
VSSRSHARLKPKSRSRKGARYCMTGYLHVARAAEVDDGVFGDLESAIEGNL